MSDLDHPLLQLIAIHHLVDQHDWALRAFYFG